MSLENETEKMVAKQAKPDVIIATDMWKLKVYGMNSADWYNSIQKKEEPYLKAMLVLHDSTVVDILPVIGRTYQEDNILLEMNKEVTEYVYWRKTSGWENWIVELNVKDIEKYQILEK